MSRDIVQFVPLRQFQSRGGANFSLVCTTIPVLVLKARHAWMVFLGLGLIVKDEPLELNVYMTLW